MLLPDPQEIGYQTPGERGGGADHKGCHVGHPGQEAERVQHQPVHDQRARRGAVIADESGHIRPGVAEDEAVVDQKFANDQQFGSHDRGQRERPAHLFDQQPQQRQFDQAGGKPQNDPAPDPPGLPHLTQQDRTARPKKM